MKSKTYLLKEISILLLFLVISSQNAFSQQPEIKEKTPWGEEVFTYPEIKSKKFLITSFGAQSAPGINNQQPIQKAIDKCHAEGGGMVVIPEGKWETSYLTLKSNVNLHLEKGALLFFSDDIELYKTPTFTRWEGIECMNYHPLIYAKDEYDIAITGEGKIDGNGQKWWSFKRPQRQTLDKLYTQVLDGVKPENRNCLAYEPTSYLRPSLIQFVSSKNVLVEGVEIGSGPMWTVHFVYCENVIAQNLKVITEGVNNDGIVPDASKKVLIDNCYFSTGDDCIVIKSGLNEDGWRVGKPSERIVIKNCRTHHGHGGVVIGSEMSGGVKNIYAYNCNFSNTQRGLRIKSMKGRGGYVKNLWMENIQMDSISDEAIKINMKYGSSSIAPRNDTPPEFSNFNFKDIHYAYSRTCINIIGLDDQKIDGLNFDGLQMKGDRGIFISDTKNSVLNDIQIEITRSEPINLEDCTDVQFNGLQVKSDNEIMFKLQGENENIKVLNSNKNDFKQPVNQSFSDKVIFQ